MHSNDKRPENVKIDICFRLLRKNIDLDLRVIVRSLLKYREHLELDFFLAF